MSAALSTDLTAQADYPYAVEVDGEFLHFANKASADFYASLMGDGVKRYVSVLAEHGGGWREVTYFWL